MLEIIKKVQDYELKNELWSGALHTIETITQKDKLQDLMDLLTDCFPKPVSMTTINDFLWFDSDFIFEQLNIQKDGEI